MCDFVVTVRSMDLGIVRACLTDEEYAEYHRGLLEQIATKRLRLEKSGYSICKAKSNGYVIAYQGDTSVFLNIRGTPRIFRNRFIATEYIISHLDTLERISNGRYH